MWQIDLIDNLAEDPPWRSFPFLNRFLFFTVEERLPQMKFKFLNEGFGVVKTNQQMHSL